MAGVSHLSISEAEDGLRFDRWAKQRFPGLTFGRLQKLCRTGQIRVDGGRVKASTRLLKGQRVRMPPLDDDVFSQVKKSPVSLSLADQEFVRSLVLYRDDHVIVINKPSGLAVQGGSRTLRHLDGLLEGLKFKAAEKPRLVHRLDKDTSGVLLLARTRKAAQHLTEAFRSGKTAKTYWVLVKGVPRPLSGALKYSLVKRMTPAGEKMYTARDGDRDIQRAITHYETRETAGQDYAWLVLSPETGRKHQIRVHCAAMGHPIVGDGKYGYEGPSGGDMLLSGRVHLHARQLVFEKQGGQRITVTAPLSDHMKQSWLALGFDQNLSKEEL